MGDFAFLFLSKSNVLCMRESESGEERERWNGVWRWVENLKWRE